MQRACSVVLGTLVLAVSQAKYADEEHLHTDHWYRHLTAEELDRDETLNTQIPHELTLSCAEYRAQCEIESRGLIIIQNECSTDHTGHRYHRCEYYTCQTWLKQCVENARGRYITQLECEHHTDGDTGTRHLIGLECKYADNCEQTRKECDRNRLGKRVRMNECYERREQGKLIGLNHTCEYHSFDDNDEMEEDLVELALKDGFDWSNLDHPSEDYYRISFHPP